MFVIGARLFFVAAFFPERLGLSGFSHLTLVLAMDVFFLFFHVVRSRTNDVLNTSRRFGRLRSFVFSTLVMYLYVHTGIRNVIIVMRTWAWVSTIRANACFKNKVLSYVVDFMM
jgi:hypothetical protein